MHPILRQTNINSTAHDMVPSSKSITGRQVLFTPDICFPPAQPLIKYGPSCLVLDPFMVQGLLSSVAVFGIHLQQMASTKTLGKKHMSVYSTNVQLIFSKDAVHLPFFGYGLVWYFCACSIPGRRTDQRLRVLGDVLPIRWVEVEVA